MDKKEQLEALVSATGALAEMTVLFYKSTIQAGASMGEAMMLTRLFIESFFKQKEE